MATFTQAQRSLSITSPLGEDVLLLQGFSGTESISRLFSYRLDLASEDDAIAAKDIVGQAVTWSVRNVHKAPRHFNGVVSRFVAGGLDRRKLRTYRAEVVPWAWFLTRSTDCRIFQNQATPDILKAVFGAFGFSDYELHLGSYPKREYCVQYRETAFNFISRLMERDGIFYSFRHANGKHTMVLADSTAAYTDVPESPVKYSSGSLAPNHVANWERHFEFRSGKWTQTDYNFETPSTSLLTTTTTMVDLPAAKKFEIFDYPGEYDTTGSGNPVTKVRMEEEEAGFDVVSAASSQCCTFTPGGRFELEGHDIDSENGGYAITSIQHTASEPTYGSNGSVASYGNAFTCIPDSVVFRPARATPKPMVQGPQTAVVVGPAGEEIYVDKYGRVKVQFFWDRVGKKDENSSCWIRVTEQSAGKGWGMICHPRIGQEVVVDFLEGDPDRPLVTGRVYNAEQMPPYPLPGANVVSGLKSKTYKGTGYNEMSMDDTTGKEKITVHGQYDMNTTIEHDQTLLVKNDRTDTVKGKHTETITKDTAITIEQGKLEHKVNTGTASYYVKSDLSEKYDANQTTDITSNQTTTVGNNIDITAKSGYIHIKAAAEIQLWVGSSKLLMKSDGSIELSGVNIGVTGKAQVNIAGGDVISKADGNHLISGGLVKSEASGANTVKGATVMLNP